MVLPLAFVLGMLLGWRRAAQRGGDRLDQLQYGAAYGIAFTLAALALTILAERLGLI
jgi:phosphate/sulfate permease